MICWDHWTFKYGFLPWIALGKINTYKSESLNVKKGLKKLVSVYTKSLFFFKKFTNNLSFNVFFQTKFTKKIY